MDDSGPIPGAVLERFARYYLLSERTDQELMRVLELLIELDPTAELLEDLKTTGA